MNATDPTLANILQVQGNIEHYHVPKYQREYTWGRNEWEQLLVDIEENEIGYFMGSIICIDDNKELGPGESRVYEVVDGQQRLTTISIILMAIYRKLNAIEIDSYLSDEEEIEEYKLQKSNIRKQLVHKKVSVNSNETGYFKDKSSRAKYCFLRVKPSTQSKNLEDYRHIMSELNIIKGDFKSKFCGLRRLYKAYNYFYDNLPDDYHDLNDFMHKINSLRFIHISVGSSSDAFVLFESLNNRGVPLSAMDIIKNKMLANLEKNHDMHIDEAYDEWQKLLSYLPEYKDQERFLRQFYNAFKVYPENRIEKYNKATKSNIIKIYEQYINNNAKQTIQKLLHSALIYNIFIDPDRNEISEHRAKLLLDLSRIGSAPAYSFLLYLFSISEHRFEKKDEVVDEVLEFFVKYYTRRNITDYPNTRSLDSINIEAIEKCEIHTQTGKKLSSQFIVQQFLNAREKPSTLSMLRKGLEDNLFYFNSGMARFVLSKLDEISHTREYAPDLWARSDKGLLVWTVEHVLPQGSNIPDCWIDMIADGNRKKAYEIHEKWVHSLGNLTLSGYNSKLSNSCFKDKQDLHEGRSFLGHRINIGYKNGLSLNTMPFSMEPGERCLATIDKWTEQSICSRNSAMVEILLRLFAFDDNELKNEEHITTECSRTASG